MGISTNARRHKYSKHLGAPSPNSVHRKDHMKQVQYWQHAIPDWIASAAATVSGLDWPFSFQSHLAPVKRQTFVYVVKKKTAKIMLKILGNTVQNLIALANGRPGFVHPYNNASTNALLPLVYWFSKRQEEGEPGGPSSWFSYWTGLGNQRAGPSSWLV